MPTKTNIQIRPGILARIIFLVAYDVAGRKLASGLIDYKPGHVKVSHAALVLVSRKDRMLSGEPEQKIADPLLARFAVA
jgi:hypothetical protein